MKISITPTIETTDDGSQTLRHPLLLDTYHSTRGAEGEARHVYIEAGFQWMCRQRAAERLSASGEQPLRPLRVLEIGFGSGLNAWLTAFAARQEGCPVVYRAIELYPVAPETARRLDYAADGLFVALHEAAWGETVRITDTFSLEKIEVSLLNCRFDTTFDLVYFDAFAPDRQPELWSREVFEMLYAAMEPGGALVTYSAKGSVKENLRSAGFDVKRLPGALGKHHMLRATKK